MLFTFGDVAIKQETFTCVTPVYNQWYIFRFAVKQETFTCVTPVYNQWYIFRFAVKQETFTYLTPVYNQWYIFRFAVTQETFTCLSPVYHLSITCLSPVYHLSITSDTFSGYLVEKRERGKDWVKASIYPVPETNFTVLNLVEGTQVEFRVSAINEAGPGKPSKTTPPHTVRDPICKLLTWPLWYSTLSALLAIFICLSID